MPEKEMTTNLPLPLSLRKRILKQADKDGRTLKPQIRELIKESLDGRETGGALNNLREWYDKTYKGIWNASEVLGDAPVMRAWADHLSTLRGLQRLDQKTFNMQQAYAQQSSTNERE